MARKEKKIKIQDGDNVLNFTIKQIPATHAFLFGVKCAKILGTLGSGATSNGDDIATILCTAASRLDVDEFQKLQNEILEESVTFTNGIPLQCSLEQLDEICEDPMTVAKLTKEAIAMNLDFFIRALPENIRTKLVTAFKDAESIWQSMNQDTKLSES